MATSGLTSRDDDKLRKILRSSRVSTVIFFALITLAAYASHASHRLIAAALVYVMGVTIIGAARGLRSGLIAGVAASLLYSFFIKKTVIDFEESSIDYYVALVSFNLAALVSGTLAGRLKDRAEVAEESRHQLNLLLNVSSKLQNAVSMEDIAEILRSTVPSQVINEHMLPYLQQNLTKERLESLSRVIDMPGDQTPALTPPSAQFDTSQIDLPAFVDLLSMAVDRCELLDQQAEGQALQRSEVLKTTLLSSISHDLRTPIAAIAASASSLKRFGDALTPDVRAQMLDTIEDQCARLDRFTAKLLSFGRLQGGVTARQLEPTDVMELLGNAVASARQTGPNHLVQKDFPDNQALVLADPAMLEQVFFNILENAMIYTPEGSKILIQVDAGGDMVNIRIRDNGRGVSPGSLDHIFEPFFRSERSRDTNGQGLGLFIAKGFVETFGGTVTAKSPHQEGSGLEITISLPKADLMLESSEHA